MPVTARRFREADTHPVHNLIIRNFLEVNVKDYGLAAMQQLAATYTEEKVRTAEYFCAARLSRQGHRVFDSSNAGAGRTVYPCKAHRNPGVHYGGGLLPQTRVCV